MNRIMKKLRSRAGASITFALLLFLVCAVLCSVILAAATASAGRMSSIAETDQRYYAVTSASELLNDLIGDKKVSIVKVTTSWSTKWYEDGSLKSSSDNHNGTGAKNPEVREYIVVDKNAAEILANVNSYLIPANMFRSKIEDVTTTNDSLLKSTILNDAAYNYYNGHATIPVAAGGSPRSLSLTPSLASAGVDLTVTIEETLDDTGRITLTVYNANGTGHFKQQLDFSADVVSSDNTKSVTGSKENIYTWDTVSGEGESAVTVTHNRYSKTTTTTRTEITSLTWTLDNIKTLSGFVSGS